MSKRLDHVRQNEVLDILGVDPHWVIEGSVEVTEGKPGRVIWVRYEAFRPNLTEAEQTAILAIVHRADEQKPETD